MDTEDRLRQARKRVEEIKGLYIHLTVYLLVNVGLFAIDALSSPGSTWFYWPAIGWGIGVAIHAATVLIGGWLGSTWEERKVQKYLERHAS